MFGYHGKFLQVDLSSSELKDLPIKEDDARKFIGGTGLSAKLIYASVKPGMDPWAASNPLVFATGPFNGTTIPMVSRSSVSGISPYTGIWGEATTGGTFPFALKNSGYDGIYITGKAAKPVYLLVNDGKAEIRDASHLWGKDIYNTQEILKGELKDLRHSVSCIGKAGENLVPYACVMNDRGRAAGRCGMGALMGSKRLKAVVAAGRSNAPVADKDRVSSLANDFREQIINAMMSIAYREYGTMLYIDMAMYLADMPAKYYTQSVFPAEKITSQELKRQYTVNSYACHGCPIGCGREVKGFRKGLDVDGPEYETTGAFGALCQNYDFDSIIQANHLCNSQGIDTISAGVSIAYAMHLFEKGILTEKKAGMPIKWGDSKTIVKLTKMIIDRKGIGELLGKGTRAMAKELGADPEEAAHVKGLEIPMHDSRAYTGQAISYATGPRGACHEKGDYYAVDMGKMLLEINVIMGDRFASGAGKAGMAARFQGFRDLFDSMCMCKFSTVSPTNLSDALNAITGWNFSPMDLYKCGERSLTLKRAINNQLGITRKDDKLPRICTQALKEGASTGKSPDMDLLLKEYYEFMQWDWATGKPTKEKLVELGMPDVANDLWHK